MLHLKYACDALRQLQLIIIMSSMQEQFDAARILNRNIMFSTRVWRLLLFYYLKGQWTLCTVFLLVLNNYSIFLRFWGSSKKVNFIRHITTSPDDSISVLELRQNLSPFIIRKCSSRKLFFIPLLFSLIWTHTFKIELAGEDEKVFWQNLHKSRLARLGL